MARRRRRPTKPDYSTWVAAAAPPGRARPRGAKCWVGLDRSQRELQRAVELGRSTLLRGDITRLPIGDRSTDVVTSSMAMMLVHPIDVALGEIRRSLRDAGELRLLLPTPSPLTMPTGWPISASSGQRAPPRSSRRPPSERTPGTRSSPPGSLCSRMNVVRFDRDCPTRVTAEAGHNSGTDRRVARGPSSKNPSARCASGSLVSCGRCSIAEGTNLPRLELCGIDK